MRGLYPYVPSDVPTPGRGAGIGMGEKKSRSDSRTCGALPRKSRVRHSMTALPALITCSGPAAHVASTGEKTFPSLAIALSSNANDSMLVWSGGAKSGDARRLSMLGAGAVVRAPDPTVGTGVSN